MKRLLVWPAVLAGVIGGTRLVHAHCPLCTAAVGAGVLGARYFGLGDSIVGLFVGAFGIATGLWLASKIKQRYIPFQTALIAAGSTALTVLPLMALSDQLLYIPPLLLGTNTWLSQALFVNKFLVGSIIGAIVSGLAWQFHLYIKKLKGRVLFPFQGIAFTIAALLVSSGFLFLFWGGG